MADSQVIARRFRPQTFAEVVGQEAITRTLTNAIEAKRLHHAYLFAGARGVGKTTTARILAKALNCVTGITTTPCGVCPSCSEIANSGSIDVLEIDAASNTGVENVREAIIATVAIAPARDRYKIFIIDEVHQLSAHAFNALLKTVEEPPPHVLFILATTEMHKVPETILSRCQVFEFRTIASRKIYTQLQRIGGELGVEISESALLSLARAGEGSMRDAESALDQVLSFAGKVVTDEDVSAALGLVGFETLNSITRAVATEDSGAILKIVDSIVSRGYDLRNLCRQMMIHLRSLLVVKIAGLDQELLEVSPAEADSLAELAEAFSEQDLLRFFSVLTKTEQDIRLSSQPRFQLEMGLVKLVHARRLYLLEDAIAQIRALGSPAAPIRPLHASAAGPPSETKPPTRPGPTAARPTSSAPPRAAASGSSAPPGFDAPPPEPPLSFAQESPDDEILTNPADIRRITGLRTGGRLQAGVDKKKDSIPNAVINAPESAKTASKVKDHPAVRALVDTFHGSVVEVKEREDGVGGGEEEANEIPG